MATLRLRPCFERLVLVSSLLVVACSGSGSGESTGNEPDSGQGGGSTGTAGAGGSTIPASGGSTGAAGMSGSGGNAGAVAGASGSAGKSGQGGTSAMGGATNAGGTSAAGGKTSTGGNAGAGGATGGNKTGGNTGAGGATGGSKTGSTTGAAGNTGSGGKGGTGGATGAGGTGAAGSTGSAGGDFGFTFRPVQDKQLDYLCTLNAAGPSTYVYVRLDQTGTKSVGIATIPVYAPALAKISVNGAVSDLANATYDYGGGHNNDSLQFDYQGKSYKYYHSSFGFGFRQCQPMDCVSIYAPGATTPTTDGCTAARALPEVCVIIKADGTHDPLVDKFKKCAGDSNK
jgi:hypothetical protein